MNKRNIFYLSKRLLGVVLAFVVFAESSMMGYASNLSDGSRVEEVDIEAGSYEDSVSDSLPLNATEEASEEESTIEETAEELSSEESSVEESLSEEDSSEDLSAEETEESNTSTEELTEEFSQEELETDVEEVTTIEEEEPATEISSESFSVQMTSDTIDKFVIEEGVLTKYTGKEADIIIPEGVTEIADRVFLSRSFIKSVTFPEGLKKIGDFAFCDCSGLVSVTFNEDLEIIGNDAFYGSAFGEANGVNGSLTIPSSVTYIGYEAFCNCTYLGEVVFENDGNATIKFGEKDSNNSMFRACSNLKKVTLPDRMVAVPAYAFQNCPLLEEVTFGNATKTIGSLAFNKCSSYKELICPTTLEAIGKYAFSDCKLENVSLNEGLQTIGEGAFYGVDFGEANKSGTLIIPSSVTYIGCVAFGSSNYLGEVIFEDNGNANIEFELQNGKNSMFMACKSLKKVTLPTRVKDIPGAAFQNCPLLEEVVFGNATESIGEIAFNKCTGLKELICPETLLHIGDFAFADCDGLVTISLNEGLQTIGEGAFYCAGVTGVKNSSRLTYSTLTIPSTVKEIGVHAFFNCQEYETIIFSNGTNPSLEFLGMQGESYAFQNCLNLKTVYLPERLKELKSLTFLNCPKLETLYIPKTVEKIADNFLEYCNADKLVIYGTTGTVAEKYATDNNITFIDSSQLGIYAKSVQLNYKNLTYVGAENFGKKVRLNATVLPGTAQNRNVIYSSKDKNVATVDSTGVVTIVGYGETDIVVVSEENANVLETCHIEVLKRWSESEINSARNYIIENNDFTLITNVSSNLQEDLLIQAGDGVTAQWQFPYEIETGTHAYAILLHKDGYESALLEDIPVTGVEISGIVVNGPNRLQVNKDSQVLVDILTEGGEISSDDYVIQWDSANKNNMSVTPMEENLLAAAISGVKVNKGTNLIARVYLLKDGNIFSDTAKNVGKTWFESKKKIVVTKDAVVDKIEVEATQNGNPIELGTLTSLTDLTDKNTYELNATAYAGNQELENIPLTYKTSNTKVAKVKTDKSGKTVLTVLGKGTCVISATAAKNGGCTTSFRVTVKDSRPRLAQKSVTMNRYLVDAQAFVTIVPSDGYTVDAAGLSIVNAKDGLQSEFEISKVSGYSYKIHVKDGKDIKKGNYAVKLLAKTSANEQEAHELPFTIKVTEQKPKVTIKQTSITPYIKDSYGELEVITSEKISDMSYTSSAGIGKARLIQKEVDIQNATLKIKTENVNSTNYNKVANKGTLIIEFDGYREEAAYKKSIKLAVNTKLPVIKATPDSSTLYPETLADTTKISLYNNSAKEEVTVSNGYGVEVNSLKNYAYTSNDYNKAPAIQALKGATKGKLTFKITNTSWIDNVFVTASCNMKIAKTPALSFSPKTLVLNAEYTMGQYDAVEIDAYVKGFKDISYASERTEIVGKNAKAQKVLDDGALLIMMEEGKIKAGITSNGYFTKGATYSYSVTAYSQQNKPVRGTLQIKICPIKSKASVSMKTKGSINLLDRENTYVLVTPTIKNYTATVTDVELYGANSGKFSAKVADGAIILQAVSGKAIAANKKYAINAYITLDSGVRLQAKITVTPKQRNPKLTQSSKSVVLFESARGMEYGAKWLVKPAANQVGEIKSIQMASHTESFGYSEGVIYVKDSTALLSGKTYTVKLAVTYKDHAKNVKPTYVSVKIDYRK